MTQNSVVLDCKSVSKSFGGVRAVDSVSVPFESGKITALIGPNGAGKTTLFHLIGGSLRPDSGEIWLQGRRIDGLPPWKVARLGVSRLFQDCRIWENLTVMENLLLGFPPERRESPQAALFSRRATRAAEQRLRDRSANLLSAVGLSEATGKPAGSLSFGQQKLLALARALAQGGSVLLLDEPAAGVNPKIVDRLLTVLKELAGQGKTIIIIEHNMNVVLRMADWVYFLDDGELAAFGLPDEVLGNREVRSAYLGL